MRDDSLQSSKTLLIRLGCFAPIRNVIRICALETNAIQRQRDIYVKSWTEETSPLVSAQFEKLELQPKCKLHNPIAAISVNTGQLSKGATSDVKSFWRRAGTWKCKVWMIECVESVSPKL